MFILYPTTIISAVTKEGEKIIIPSDYYKKKSSDIDNSYYILYDNNMLYNKKVAFINANSYALLLNGNTLKDATILTLGKLKEMLEFKSLKVKDSYYIRDVSTSQKFYLGDKIAYFKNGEDIFCPSTVIFTDVLFLNNCAKLVFTKDCSNCDNNKSTVELTNREWSHKKFLELKYCPFYDDYYIIDLKPYPLFSGIC